MHLGRKHLTVGEVIRYVVDLADWLVDGEIITTCTPQITTTVTSTVSAATLSPTKRHFAFFVTAGAAGDDFTVKITTVTSLTQTRIDTLKIKVVAVE